MKDTWKPDTAGVLNIVSGMYGILWGLLIVTQFENIWSTVFFIVGLVALVEGIYAIKRSRWPLALAGSISAILLAPVITIPSVVLILQSKNDFAGNRFSDNQTKTVEDGSVISVSNESPSKNRRRVILYVASMIAAISFLVLSTVFAPLSMAFSSETNDNITVVLEGMAIMTAPAIVIIFGAMYYTKNVLHSLTKYSVVLFIALGLVTVSFPFVLMAFEELF